MIAKTLRLFLLWLVACSFTVVNLFAQEDPNQETAIDMHTPVLEDFDKVWETISEAYIDPDFGGLDWEVMKEQYRPKVNEAPDAEAAYRAALDAQPDAHWAMDGLARTLLARGEAAEPALQLAKAAYGRLASPRYLETAALAYAAMGDPKSARIAAEAAVRMDPDNAAYRATLTRVTATDDPE